MKYISLVPEEYYGDAPPRFAKKIRDHERYINRLKKIVFGAAEVRGSSSAAQTPRKSRFFHAGVPRGGVKRPRRAHHRLHLLSPERH